MSCGCTRTSMVSTSASGTIVHDLLAGRDNPSHRMHRKLVNDAILRCANVDALQLVLGRNLLLH